jgi:hypothetical protein
MADAKEMIEQRNYGRNKSRVTLSPNSLSPEQRRDPDVLRQLEESGRAATKRNREYLRDQRRNSR